MYFNFFDAINNSIYFLNKIDKRLRRSSTQMTHDDEIFTYVFRSFFLSFFCIDITKNIFSIVAFSSITNFYHLFVIRLSRQHDRCFESNLSNFRNFVRFRYFQYRIRKKFWKTQNCVKNARYYSVNYDVKRQNQNFDRVNVRVRQLDFQKRFFFFQFRSRESILIKWRNIWMLKKR